MKVRTKIKSLILLSAAFCVSLGLGAALSQSTDTKKVSAESIQTDIMQIEGLSLRYTDGVYDPAVRFHVSMTGELYNQTVKKGAETGVLVIPKHLLKGNELTIDNVDAVKGVFSTAGGKNAWSLRSDGTFGAKVVITSIPESAYGTVLTIRTYSTLNGVTTYGETYEKASLAAVAVEEWKANPDKEENAGLLDTYATFDVSINGYDNAFVYGNTVPFADALTLTNASGTATWDSDRAVTGSVTLKATANAEGATLPAQEIDLDINNDGSLNTGNIIEFDLSSLNVGSLTYGTDYSLTEISLGGVALADISTATVNGDTLSIPASAFGLSYGEQDLVFTFDYCGLSVKANVDALLISKKISDKTELDAMNTIMLQYLDSDANTYGGYFVLDSDIKN